MRCVDTVFVIQFFAGFSRNRHSIIAETLLGVFLLSDCRLIIGAFIHV